MKILIDNAVPLNVGDAALVFALENNLRDRNTVEFSTLKVEKVSSIYPDYKWYKSFLNKKIYNLLWRVKSVWKFLIFLRLTIFKNEYKDSNVIISAPGGYIHSYYGIEQRMFILYICKKYLKKRVGIYSQSIGKLNSRDKKILFKYGKDLDFIYVRDELSFKRINSFGNFNNVTLTKDAAFMLPSYRRNILNERIIGISVREWDVEGRSTKEYTNMIEKIVTHLLNKGYKIEFISTCQGIEGYIDDSVLAESIIKKMGLQNNNNVMVDKEFNDLEKLRDKLRNYHAVIGTRLHLCILSMLTNIPALNISYEEKGKEVYRYLGLEKFTIDYNDKGDFLSTLEKFLIFAETDLSQLWERIDVIRNEQLKYLKRSLDNENE